MTDFVQESVSTQKDDTESLSQQEGSGAPSVVHYSFKLSGEVSSLNDKGLKESLLRWGILDALSITKVRFTPGFMPHEERNFLRQLLTFMGEKTQPKGQSRTGIQEVRWEPLCCTTISMEFFDCLVEKGIVTGTGNIRGCFDDVFDGIGVADKLREVLVNPDSENADAFSPEQQHELIFHVFKALCVGGAVCQPDDRLEAYMQATKLLYKSLVSVRKNSTTGALEISPCRVYRITGINGGGDTHCEVPGYGFSALFPTSKRQAVESPHHMCLVVVDPSKRGASVLLKQFIPFW